MPVSAVLNGPSIKIPYLEEQVTFFAFNGPGCFPLHSWLRPCSDDIPFPPEPQPSDQVSNRPADHRGQPMIRVGCCVEADPGDQVAQETHSQHPQPDHQGCFLADSFILSLNRFSRHFDISMNCVVGSQATRACTRKYTDPSSGYLAPSHACLPWAVLPMPISISKIAYEQKAPRGA